MSLPKFIVGLAFVIAIIVVWSILDSAPLGTVLLRVVVVAALLQVGYFLFVLAMVARQRRKPAETTKMDKAEEPGDVVHTAKAEDLTVGRPFSH